MKLAILTVISVVTLSGCVGNRPMLEDVGDVTSKQSITWVGDALMRRAYKSAKSGWFNSGEYTAAGWSGRDEYISALRAEAIRRYKWDAQTIDAVDAGLIFVGMPKEALLWSWGEPRHDEQRVNSDGQQEYWTYSRDYVHIENGVVTMFTKYR